MISYIRGSGNLGSGSGFGFGKLCPPLGLARLLGVVGGGQGACAHPMHDRKLVKGRKLTAAFNRVVTGSQSTRIEHMNIIRFENPGKSEAWITRHHIDSFAVWLRRKLMGDKTIDEQLQWLARGPSITIMQYQGYEINGYTFYTRAQEEKSTNQNSGVRIDTICNDGNKDSNFGVIEEIWELDYGPLKIPLFRCQWVNRAGGGVTTDQYGMLIVDFKKVGYKDEPFVLAKDVAPVFYVKDMSSKFKKN